MPGGEALSVDLYKDGRWSGPVSPGGQSTKQVCTLTADCARNFGLERRLVI